jgi:hypothetical protein
MLSFFCVVGVICPFVLVLPCLEFTCLVKPPFDYILSLSYCKEKTFRRIFHTELLQSLLP